MREEYRRELEAVGPDGLELARLTGRLKAGNGRRSGVLRPALIAAVLTVVLLGSVGAAAAWRGWLEPVVSYGDNGALIEEYTVAVNETREGNQCNVTLKNLVTDGHAVYALFGAEFDPDFDFNAALDKAYWYISRPSWMPEAAVTGSGSTFSRVDDRSQPGRAEFIAQLYMERGSTMYYFDEEGVWNQDKADSLLGRVLTICLSFGNQKENWYELYYFEDVQFNDTIELVELEWDDADVLEDGTRLDNATRMIVSPLSVYVDCSRGPVLEVLPENALGNFSAFRAAYEEVVTRWEQTDWIEAFDVKLALADGTFLELSQLPRSFEGSSMHASFGSPDVGVRISSGFFFPELRRPETVTALIINGVRYEVD